MLNYLYVDASIANFERLTWHNYYNEDENIDNLYLGSSHVYSDINPFLLDDLNGENNFNLSSASQRLNASYYLLKEVDKDHELKHVYLELYYIQSTGNNGKFKEHENLTWALWRNADYMKWSANKLEYILTQSKPENYIEAFLPFIRYRSLLFDAGHVKLQLERKSEKEYKNFDPIIVEYERGGGISVWMYLDKGYEYSTQKSLPEDLKWEENNILEESPMTEDAEKYLRKIIEYCEKENIALTCFSSPTTMLETISTENYDAYVRQIREILQEYGMTYYDFNLCREEYLPIQAMQYFQDNNHLNAEGADIFTRFFYQFMQSEGQENEKYFFDTYEEKLQETQATVYGIRRVFPEKVDNEENVYWQIVANWTKRMEYRILITPYGQTTVLIQDFSESPYFTVPKDEHGICTIVAREAGKETVQTLEVEY